MKITIDSEKLDALIEKYSGINITGVSMNSSFLKDLRILKEESDPVHETKIDGEWGIHLNCKVRSSKPIDKNPNFWRG